MFDVITEKLTRLAELAELYGLPLTAQTIEGYLAEVFANEGNLGHDLLYYDAVLNSFEYTLNAAHQQILTNQADKNKMDQALSQQMTEIRDALNRAKELDDLLKDKIREKGHAFPQVQEFGQNEAAFQQKLRENKETMDLAALKERNRRKAKLLKQYYGVKDLPELKDGTGAALFDAIKNLFNVYADPNHSETDLQNAFTPMIGMLIQFIFSMFKNLFKGILGEKRAEEVDQVADMGAAMVQGMAMNEFKRGQEALAQKQAQQQAGRPPILPQFQATQRAQGIAQTQTQTQPQPQQRVRNTI